MVSSPLLGQWLHNLRSEVSMPSMKFNAFLSNFKVLFYNPFIDVSDKIRRNSKIG